MQDSHLFNGILGVGVAGTVFALLYLPIVRRSQMWTITVTPLASIIGSGFLISAPLLYGHFGAMAVPAVILINLLALGVGLAIHHNIRHFDPDRPAMMRANPALSTLGRLASVTLALSYVVSITFYVTLLSAFGLAIIGIHQKVVVSGTSTAVLLLIGAAGFLGGIHRLESLEKVAVNLKISIIAGLLSVLAVFRLSGGGADVPIPFPTWHLRSFQVLAGLLLITQGFETVKYLGHEYEIRPRLKAMLLAQLIATFIYVAFVGMVGPLAIGSDGTDETAIINVIAKLSFALGVALSVGAIFSQFSAAVADTVGTGGIVAQESNGRVPERVTYLCITAAAIGLLWSMNVFAVMSLASRAFAAYYAIQCVIAAITTWSRPPSRIRTATRILFPVLAVLLAVIAVVAIPAE